MKQASVTTKPSPAQNISKGEGASYVPNAIHLVRTAQQMQLQLSQMADQKASILMGATFVCFTIAIGQLSSRDISPSLVILATFAFLAAILAMMVVMPRVGKMPPEMADASLLFFGAFAQIPEDEFVEKLKNRLVSDDLVYMTMIRDMHQNGAVLAGRKYKYLGYAYRTFLTGLVLTFLSFTLQESMALLG